MGRFIGRPLPAKSLFSSTSSNSSQTTMRLSEVRKYSIDPPVCQRPAFARACRDVNGLLVLSGRLLSEVAGQRCVASPTAWSFETTNGRTGVSPIRPFEEVEKGAARSPRSSQLALPHPRLRCRNVLCSSTLSRLNCVVSCPRHLNLGQQFRLSKSDQVICEEFSAEACGAELGKPQRHQCHSNRPGLAPNGVSRWERHGVKSPETFRGICCPVRGR